MYAIMRFNNSSITVNLVKGQTVRGLKTNISSSKIVSESQLKTFPSNHVSTYKFKIK